MIDQMLRRMMEQEGRDDAWLEAQPEPTSDCSTEEEHYASLITLGSCPMCGQDEVTS